MRAAFLRSRRGMTVEPKRNEVVSHAYQAAGNARRQSVAAERCRRLVMGIIIWLIIGGICGWLASIIMRTDGQQGIILNIVVGIVGSVIASLIFGVGINDAITVTTFIYSLIGAIILLAIVNLVRRGTVR
jgi:uncharacterized membrane protein YeaQ/YmgE (transglycosylase-associated protein family)